MSRRCKEVGRLSSLPEEALSVILSLMPLSKSRRCKEVDRLSSLPEEVISVILSHMPTKFAVRTSILSKKWRYTWTLIHNLDFDDIRSKSYSHVDRVLMICKTTRIKMFRLHFCKIYIPNSSTVSKWISEAVRLNVSEIDVEMISNIGLPLSLFTCTTLSKLSLKLIHHHNENEFSWECPPSIYLPNLKTLDITDNFKFDNNINSISWDNISKVIHGCPLLEDLSLMIHIWCNTEDFYFKAPTLKRLTLSLLFSSSMDNIHKVVLNVPNLEYLHIEESLLWCSLFVMEDLSSLVTAEVSFSFEYDHLWVELLKGLSKVKNLTLDITNAIGDEFYSHFPEFPHVKKLVIVGCDPLRLRKLSQILKRFCQLEHLCIKKEQEGQWSIQESFPTLTLTNIVKVEFTDTTWLGDFDTIQFLKFILKNAVDLKKLIVKYNTDLGTSLERQGLNAELSKFPRASRKCQIYFAPYN